MTMKTFRKRVHEVVLQGVKTTDAARPTRDALLSCPSDSEWREYCKSVAQGVDLGQVWNGIEASMDALDDDKRKAICDRFDAYRELKDGKKRQKASGALDGAAPDYDIFGRRESAKIGEAINAAHARAWNKPAR
jgi:hypothetical protein